MVGRANRRRCRLFGRAAVCPWRGCLKRRTTAAPRETLAKPVARSLGLGVTSAPHLLSRKYGGPYLPRHTATALNAKLRAMTLGGRLRRLLLSAISSALAPLPTSRKSGVPMGSCGSGPRRFLAVRDGCRRMPFVGFRTRAVGAEGGLGMSGSPGPQMPLNDALRVSVSISAPPECVR